MIAKKLTIVMAAALLTVGAATARAEEEKPYGGKAPYFSVGGVYGIENVDGVPGSLSDSGGYDLRLGYNHHDMFALETEWQSLVNFNRQAENPVTGNDEPSLEARMLSLNGRFMPLSGRVQPYALLGMGWVNVQADRVSVYEHESSFGMRFGLGVAAYLTERIGLALEAAYILPLSGDLGGGNSFDIIPITASIFFRFK
jgi:opacity protein-like surface antigen